METVSWLFWGVWLASGVGFEVYAVKTETRSGALPLTRVVRDRLMRRAWPFKIAGMAFLGWLALHFLEPLSW